MKIPKQRIKPGLKRDSDAYVAAVAEIRKEMEASGEFGEDDYYPEMVDLEAYIAQEESLMDEEFSYMDDL